MTFGQFLFHWALDLASVVQFATVVTIIPIGVIWNIWVNPFDLFDRTHVEYMSIITLGAGTLV